MFCVSAYAEIRGMGYKTAQRVSYGVGMCPLPHEVLKFDNVIKNSITKQEEITNDAVE